MALPQAKWAAYKYTMLHPVLPQAKWTTCNSHTSLFTQSIANDYLWHLQIISHHHVLVQHGSQCTWPQALSKCLTLIHQPSLKITKVSHRQISFASQWYCRHSTIYVDGMQLIWWTIYFQNCLKMIMICGSRSGNGRRYRLSMLLSWLSHFFFVAHGVRCFHDLIWLLFPINLHFLFHLLSHHVPFSWLRLPTQESGEM